MRERWRSTSPTYAIGQVSIARRTLDARKCTTELCRYLEPVFAALEGPRKNTRHNSGVGIMAELVHERRPFEMIACGPVESVRNLNLGSTVVVKRGLAVDSGRQLGVVVELGGP